MRFVWVNDRFTSQVINKRALWCVAKSRLLSRYIFQAAVL